MADSERVLFDKVNGRVPVALYVNDEIAPSERAIEQLYRIAREEGLKGPVIALPDIHDKKENDFPTGVVAASRTKIYPQILVSGVNCGMRMIKTPLLFKDLKEEDVDSLFLDFVRQIKTRGYASKILSFKEIIDILRKGACWVVDRNGSSPEELDSIEQGGNAFGRREVTPDEVLAVLPKPVIDIARFRLGFLGKGNHFLEMQAVEEIFDNDAASEFGLKKDQVVFLLHSGSGGFGSIVGHFYTPRERYTEELKMRLFIMMQRANSLWSRQRRGYIGRLLRYRYSKRGDIFSLEAGSPPAESYLSGLSAAANFGYANRQYLSDQVRTILKKRFSLKKESLSTLYDMSHISINREPHGGTDLWVHRSGASRAFSADRLSSSSRFKKTGEPVFLPGSMGDATYLCVSLSGNSRTFFSAGHGAGRRPMDEISSFAGTPAELKEKLLRRKVRLYKGLSKGITRQDPGCFKDIEAAVRVYTGNGFLRPVLKTRPVAVLKG